MFRAKGTHYYTHSAKVRRGNLQINPYPPGAPHSFSWGIVPHNYFYFFVMFSVVLLTITKAAPIQTNKLLEYWQGMTRPL